MSADERGAGEGHSFAEPERAELSVRRWAICVADFYEDLAERLGAGALAGFATGGVGEERVDTYRVAGAFDLPQAADACGGSGRYAGIVCLGVVIRGETSHYEHVCAEAARGVQEVALRHGLACAFGVITAENRAQAEARAGGDHRDQGRHAAVAAMRTHLARAAASQR